MPKHTRLKRITNKILKKTGKATKARKAIKTVKRKKR